MKLYKRKLKNGLRLQAIEMPGTNVITTMILAGAGSRYETLANTGISHFLEHMFFKGAKRYPTPASVAQAVDKFGGVFNAFTGKEYAGYFIKSSSRNLNNCLDVLSDMLINSKFAQPEIERERGVILEEMAMYQDMPTYQISWDFEQLVFGQQPLGRDQIGTREVIENVNHRDFVDYKKSLYTPDNLVISIAGAVNEKDLDLIEKYFVMPDENKSFNYKPFDANIATEKIKFREKSTEQFHLSLGVRAISENDKMYPVAKVLATILGGNMSSRMFQNIRERKGLCYSIRTSIDEYTDTGLLSTTAGVKLSEALPAIQAIRNEYDDIVKKGCTQEEFENAKNFIFGKTDLQTEDTETVAHIYAKDELLYSKVKDFEQWKKEIENVKKDEVENLARNLLKPENFRLAAIGPKLDENAVLEILR